MRSLRKMGGRESGTKSTNPHKSCNREEGQKKELVPPGRQHQADRVIWHDDGSLSLVRLLMEGQNLGDRQG